MQYHDAETLGMTRSVLAQSNAAVQVALNRFWEHYGKPTPQLLEMLRGELTGAVRETLAAFFGASGEPVAEHTARTVDVIVTELEREGVP